MPLGAETGEPTLMDALDKAILRIMQQDFPLEPRPFTVIGNRVGLTEEETLSRVENLKERGMIRRIGAVFDREALGRDGTLCAARVPVDRLDAFVSAVNALPGVTHNYLRNHDYNVWFTLIAGPGEDIDATLASLREQTGVSDILDMRAARTFKISAVFDL